SRSRSWSTAGRATRWPATSPSRAACCSSGGVVAGLGHHGRGMKSARWLSLLVVPVLLASAWDEGGDGGSGSGDGKPTRGVKRGTLRVYSHTDVDALDPGVAYAAFDFALLRGMVRELYSFDSRVSGERSLQPVPDLADGPYTLSDDG